MSYNTLTVDLTEGLATLKLHRPDAANALSGEMARELVDIALRLGSDASVRAVLITAEGKMFCPGGDLRDMDAQGDAKHEYLTRMATDLHNAITRFQHMDAPVVIGVNGVAAGAGFSMVLTGDYVVAADTAKLVSAYTASGLTPDGSSTFFLAKHVGLLRAKELMMTNRTLSAAEALDWGIVNKVVPADELPEAALAQARAFADGPTKAFGALKALLLRTYSESLEAQLDAETRGISGMMHTHDGPHGLASFLNKEKPRFEGR